MPSAQTVSPTALCAETESRLKFPSAAAAKRAKRKGMGRAKVQQEKGLIVDFDLVGKLVLRARGSLLVFAPFLSSIRSLVLLLLRPSRNHASPTHHARPTPSGQRQFGPCVACFWISINGQQATLRKVLKHDARSFKLHTNAKCTLFYFKRYIGLFSSSARATCLDNCLGHRRSPNAPATSSRRSHKQQGDRS
jgi:hypothetical protein